MIDINPDSANSLVTERQHRVKSLWTPRSTAHRPGPLRLALGRGLIRFGEFVGGRPTIRTEALDPTLQGRIVTS